MAGDFLSANPWKTDESRFPRSGSLQDQLAFCVNYAVLAPSIYNTQPWLFRPLDGVIELYADRSRQLPVTDPDGREMIISCGAALSNLLVTIHHFGHEGWVQYAPDPANPDLMARIRIGRNRVPDHQDEAMFRSILRRRSARRPFQSRPLPRDLQRRLIWLASEYGCWLYFAEAEEDRASIANLVETAHNRQMDDAGYQAERAVWTGDGHSSRLNETLAQAAPELSQPELQDGSRPHSAVGTVRQHRDRDLVGASPGLFILGTSSDTPQDWLRAGEAVQQILLRAESENISSSFLNQPCQLADLREQLRLITGRNGPAQLVLRMGYATGSKPTSRRPVRDVILPSNHVS
jgi:hypothetical protein